MEHRNEWLLQGSSLLSGASLMKPGRPFCVLGSSYFSYGLPPHGLKKHTQSGNERCCYQLSESYEWSMSKNCEGCRWAAFGKLSVHLAAQVQKELANHEREMVQPLGRWGADWPRSHVKRRTESIWETLGGSNVEGSRP